jgi:cytochrome bd-type quinol oxidase subunit 2
VPTLLTMLLLGTLVALGSASHLTGFSHWSSLPWLVLVSLVGFVTYVAIAVTAARLYGWLGEAVKAGARG